MRRRDVITGMGLVVPHGLQVQAVWEQIRSNRHRSACVIAAMGDKLGAIERMAAAPTDGPIYLVTVSTYRDVADYPDGRDSALTGREDHPLAHAELHLARLEVGDHRDLGPQLQERPIELVGLAHHQLARAPASVTVEEARTSADDHRRVLAVLSYLRRT